MTATGVLSPSLPTERHAPARRGELALVLQEAFTVAARLRANRPVATDAEAFRLQVKQLLSGADQEARRLGYDPAFVRLAIYAFVAFLDESVLNSTQPMFAGWARQPLQEEVFGDHMAGETFFAHLDELLSRQDSEEVADVLEVFLLCMLLGFHGRYGIGDGGGLHARIATAQEKIQRIRGLHPFSPAAELPAGETAPVARDPWVPRLTALALASLAGVIVLWLAFHLSLGSQVEDLRSLVVQLTR
jgi:type VI secretion system protein ImpK